MGTGMDKVVILASLGVPVVGTLKLDKVRGPNCLFPGFGSIDSLDSS